jgi:hypothetical protein
VSGLPLGVRLRFGEPREGNLTGHQRPATQRGPIARTKPPDAVNPIGESQWGNLRRGDTCLRSLLPQARSEAISEAALSHQPPMPVVVPPPHTVPSDLVPIPEAATTCRVHEQTIREWIRRGVITVYGRPGCFRVSLSDCMPIAHHASPIPQPSRRTKRPGIGPQKPPGTPRKPSRPSALSSRPNA